MEEYRRIVTLRLATVHGACKLWAASVGGVSVDEVYVGLWSVIKK